MDHQELPIYELEHDIIAALTEGSRLVLQAPTGSGKSTQTPQILLDAGLASAGEIVVLQPRRLAARMLAARVASERNTHLGDEVGYQIRFDKVTSARTRIRFVTEGVLLRQMLDDLSLRGIAAILFDEFHERHLYGDITLARALGIQESTRPDLRIVVMSATLDAAKVEQYLAPCAVLSSRGRTHPVEIDYLDAPFRTDEHSIWEMAVAELELAAPKLDGDVLIFMPGAYEINRTIEEIRSSSIGREFLALPLHGDLPPRDQDAAVAPADRTKVIVSTNVAETSLTIEGVTLVIDSGLARIARFDPHRGINTLLIEKISQASADQRAGRAGRTAPGRCIRLWTEREHHLRPAQELPEIKRLDLAEIVLTLKASGVANVRGFRWLEPPDPVALERAETLLTDLGALEPGGNITPIGRRMLAFPVHPRYARMFLAAHELGCVRAIALVAALTQGRMLLRRPEGRAMTHDRAEILGETAGSDFFILMRAWQLAVRNDGLRCRKLGINMGAAQEAARLRDQFLQIAEKEKLDLSRDEPTEEAIQRCLLVGFSDQLAVRLDTGTLRCALVHGRRGLLARESVVQESHLLVASEVREIERGGGDVEVLLTLATAVREEWLREMLPHDFSEKVDPRLDPAQRRVIGFHETRFRDLILRSEQTDDVSDDAAARILAEAVIAGEFPLKAWDHAVDQWIERVNCAADWFPDYQIPPLTGDDRRAIIEQVCYGARSYREIKDRAVWPAVKSWLSPAQQAAVEHLAPERITLPNGRKAKVAYARNAPPTIAVRIQDLYGVSESLAIGDGRVPLVIQVLAPNHRPVQITQNLATFWRESYPKLKLELQRKYPKHEWR
jgi:ATP-dependent helicase HrpB